MISLIFIALAAICNSIMDVTRHHWSDSIFYNFRMNRIFWYRWFHEESWRNCYICGLPRNGRIKWSIFGIKFNKPVQICDAWHFFKMMMLIFFLLSDVSLLIGYKEKIEIMQFNITGNIWWDVAIYKAIWAVAWIQPFNLFYKRIWIKK